MRDYMQNIAIFLLFFILFAACAPDVRFEEPQPPHRKDAEGFGSKIQGNFLSLKDSSIITISKDAIDKVQYVTIPYAIKQVQEPSKQQIKEGLSAKVTADSVYQDWSAPKTLFKLTEKNILRDYQEHYFLNTQEKDSTWSLQLLGFDEEGYLWLKSFLENDIETLKEYIDVKEVKNDNGEISRYSLQPTKKQLKRLLKSQELMQGGKFIRLKITR